MQVTWKDARMATLHCLTGCAIGEVVGMVFGTAFALSNFATVALSIVLAFVFGYTLTVRGLTRAGLTVLAALPIALAADTLSIATMELVDNGVVLLIPGAINATLASPLFWFSLALSLLLAFLAAWPMNRTLMSRGMGHARVHAVHEH